MNNLLETFSFTLINFAEPSISGVAVIVKWLVGICSSIALGIILFTIVLKLITFPFDFFSRYSMRKNSLKMEEMRPELEKLQKQYADNKALYNQKMMALYKKNGYSMWGSCLPTILTIVIFFVAISGFSSFSQYQNKLYFYNMSEAYNSAFYDEIEYDNEYIIKNEKGVISLNKEKFTARTADVISTTNAKTSEPLVITVVAKEGGYYISTDGGKYKLECTTDFALLENNSFITDSSETFNATRDLARARSAEAFRQEQTSFLWVKNIWNVDSPFEPIVYSNWKSEVSGCGSCAGCFDGRTSGFSDKQVYKTDADGNDNMGGNMNAERYAELTFNLQEEKDQGNGYLILCILSAGVSLIMQLVMTKSQKAQMELQTVDGQGAQQQKMMLIMMPIMMAIFSFMYTAAFSIYLILSSIISIGTTFLINKVADIKLGNTKKNRETKQVIRGRVYNKPVETEKSKKDKSKQVKKTKVRDFIQSEDENKSIRDRLK